MGADLRPASLHSILPVALAASMRIAAAVPAVAAMSACFCGALLSPMPAQADAPEIVGQLEALRNSLPPGDPARSEIGLRLADAYFSAAVDDEKRAELGPAGDRGPLMGSARKSRVRALELYREAEQTAKLDDLKIRIRFQQAQLLDAMARSSEALPLWRDLSKQSILPKVKTDALLRVAQSLETSSSPAARAEAEECYRRALDHCGEGDLCGFVHYRYGWLLRNRGEKERAAREVKQALWDARGNLQEEPLRDLLVFLADIPGDGSKAMAEIEPIAQKTGRQELYVTLAENFFAAGNKPAGVATLEFALGRTPHLGRFLRVAEERYGQRDWEKFRSSMAQAEARADKGFAPDELGGDAEKILRRLAIQLDGERTTSQGHDGDFAQASLMYLRLFPGQEPAFRMMQSWLTTAPNDEARIAMLGRWLTEAEGANPQRLSKEQRMSLLESRAATAQKTGDRAVLRQDLETLAKDSSTEDKRRQAAYALARSFYEAKEYDEALSRFKRLAVLPASGTASAEPDKYAVLSQNLALDVLNVIGDYAGIAAQAALWTSNTALTKNPKMKEELGQIRGIAEQASFESAVKAGETEGAKASFLSFCLAGRFEPKSCENAKTLAVKLGDRDALIAVLEKQGDRAQAANEHEAAGRFAKAAELMESQTPLAKKAWSSEHAVRIALLFELGDRAADRDRWLTALLDRQRGKKRFDVSEALLLQTLLEAALIRPSDLSLPWSPENKVRLAAHFESIGKGTPATRKLLMDSKIDAGPVWAEMVLREADARDLKQRKIDFHGRNGRARFERRLQALKDFEGFALGYVNGALRPTKARLLIGLQHAYRDLASAIMGTPAPEGLDEAMKAELAASLKEMAAPFVGKADQYKQLATDQIAKLEEQTERDALAAALEGQRASLLARAPQSAPAGAASARSWKPSEIQPLVQELESSKAPEPALAKLKQFFSERNEMRLASYFEGRLRTLGKDAAP